MSPDVIDSLTQQSILNVMPHVTLNLKEPALSLVKILPSLLVVCVSVVCVLVGLCQWCVC